MVTEAWSAAIRKYWIADTVFTGQATGGFPTAGWECQVKSSFLQVAVDWLTVIR
jgi:hypothetical protein